MEGCNESFCVLNAPTPNPSHQNSQSCFRSPILTVSLYILKHVLDTIFYSLVCVSVYLSKIDSLKKQKQQTTMRLSLKVQVICAPSAAGQVQSRS